MNIWGILFIIEAPTKQETASDWVNVKESLRCFLSCKNRLLQVHSSGRIIIPIVQHGKSKPKELKYKENTSFFFLINELENCVLLLFIFGSGHRAKLVSPKRVRWGSKIPAEPFHVPRRILARFACANTWIYLKIFLTLGAHLWKLHWVINRFCRYKW